MGNKQENSLRIARRFLCILFCILPALVSAQIRLPKLIGDGMILQRDMPVKIWGWASPGEEISLQFNDSHYHTVAEKSGDWQIALPGQKAGGPHSITVKASNSITIEDIWFGDVWICSGQSNMELPVRRVLPLYEQEIAAAAYPQIRQFQVPQRYHFNNPQTDFESGRWTAAYPGSVLDFPAAAYFFALELYRKYQVPVGLINNALGGSPAEAWISEDSLRRYPHYYAEVQQFKNELLVDSIIQTDKARISAWYTDLYLKDKGYRPPVWYAGETDTSGWPAMHVPGYWEQQNGRPVNGAVWFRRDFDLPASFLDNPLRLILGAIVDADSVYLNGQLVGATSYQYPPRRYDVPADILKEGKNTITVRVISHAGRGGFVEDKFYGLESGNQKFDLSGEWRYRSGAGMLPLQAETFIRWKPAGLYNAMLAPLFNYPVKGVIWYQGESNTGRAGEYKDLFATLINDWRSRWRQGDFPFLFVQLANFMKSTGEPAESSWAELRESQLKTLALPNTGMAVTIDIGEWNDIHPLNKKDVGKRLALAAGKIAYGENNTVYSGPVYESMMTAGNKIILTFSHTGSGLTLKGEPLNVFAIAGEDKRFVWAKAEIENNRLVVWSDDIAQPVAVRYAWADNPSHANLYNKEGLPASPFRTDDFDIRHK
jgi:sialate O-acetylesterase